jgi:D-methionine transport system ATP-binding protein
MIKLKSITTSYALKDLDLEVSKASITGIIGKSGSGKSTLLRTVNLLERPLYGEVYFDGLPLTSLNEIELRKQRQKMGMIFQHFNLLSYAKAFKNVALPLEAAGKEKKEIQERVNYLLEVTGLSDKRDSYPHELSGGQKQRVAIARALALNPKVLLCDEITSALDPQNAESILELLVSINNNFGVSILFISHQMELVNKICHEVAILEEGQFKCC